ncbi:hypothetical protein [Spiroplasma endosymbiont of Diplazon laetatorius]|uniref:hypothetical protein n=1 Tax=Spiroplasma endosymbiont of Diplazon laetatorius TaxID=3066322 RepID=UPI0030CA7384
MFLAYEDTWNEAINVIVDIFMKCADWMWSLTLPATDIPLYTIWITAAIIKVMLMILGSDTRFSSLSGNVKNAHSKAVRKSGQKFKVRDNGKANDKPNESSGSNSPKAIEHKGK